MKPSYLNTKKPLYSRTTVFLATLFTFLFAFFQIVSISAQNRQPDPIKIISQVISHESLWEKLPLTSRNPEAYLILNHGVELNIALGASFQGKPITLINKQDIDGLNGQAYFLFHTLNIESSKALARVYLVHHTENGEESEFAEFSFTKQNSNWILTTTTL